MTFLDLEGLDVNRRYFRGGKGPSKEENNTSEDFSQKIIGKLQLRHEDIDCKYDFKFQGAVEDGTQGQCRDDSNSVS